jgi:hypothetical protein
MSSYRSFFSDVLSELGYPVTEANMEALAAVSILEGANNRYNPLNSVVPNGNSTSFNDVGVQDYKSYANGVAGTVALLRGSAWAGVDSALRNGSSKQGVLGAFQNVYQGWDPGVQFNAGNDQIARTLGSSLGADSVGAGVPVANSAYMNNGDGGSGGGGNMGSGVASGTPTAANYASVAGGGLQNLLTHIPELKGILNSFLTPGGAHYGGSTADFQDAIQGSKWWKTNSATTRQMVILSLNDPAEYKKQLSDAERQVNTEAGQLGVHLNAYQTLSVAHAGLLGGTLTDKAWLDGLLTGTINPASYKNTNGLSGQLASTVAQLQQLAASYGTASTPGGDILAAKNILSGATTIDTYANHYKTVAKSMFPGLSSQIDSGMTVAQLAQPYQSTMGQLLEIDPGSIKLSDPMIRKALQGTSGAADGKTTVPTSQPLWQFENTVRSDPRWAMTNNAKDTASTALMKIGQDWGFM